MTSRALLNLVLSLSLAGLIALAMYEPGKDAPPVTATLTQLDPEHIQHIQIHATGKPAVNLKKSDDRWLMLAPFSVYANQQRITQLLKIAKTISLAAYPMDQVDVRQFKLDEPMLTITLDDVSLRFGSTSPLGGSRYVQIDGFVHLITDRYSHLTRNTADLVSPSIINRSETIIGLHLPTLELKLAEGQWQLASKDTELRRNPDHIQRLLDEWRHARALDVQPLDLQSQDQQQSPAIIRLTTETGTLRFEMQLTEDELILQRRDLGLQYHFSRETGQRLLSLQQPDMPAKP